MSNASHQRTPHILVGIKNSKTREIEVLKSREYYSVRHILSASLFRDLAKKIETNNSEDLYKEHQAYVINSIFSSVAFLEATINELYKEIVDPSLQNISPFDKRITMKIKDIWDMDIPKTASYPVLHKYQILLSLGERELFDKGISPYQDIEILIKLRNHLIHYEPGWTMIDPSSDSKLEIMLNKKFKPNPFVRELEFCTLERFFGYGCANWAITNSIKFTDEFYKKIDWIPEYNNIRSQLL